MLSPAWIERATSTEPSRRSSVTPRGICTKGAGMTRVGRAAGSMAVGPSPSPLPKRSRVWSSHSWGLAGSALQQEPSTTSMGGNSWCSARAITDLAVPRRPAIATPPRLGSTAASSRAILIAPCSTTAGRGNTLGREETAGAIMAWTGYLKGARVQSFTISGIVKPWPRLG